MVVACLLHMLNIQVEDPSKWRFSLQTTPPKKKQKQKEKKREDVPILDSVPVMGLNRCTFSTIIGFEARHNPFQSFRLLILPVLRWGTWKLRKGVVFLWPAFEANPVF